MENRKHRYRYQIKKTVLLLIDNKTGNHITDALYNGSVSNFGFQLPFKWEDGIDDSSIFTLPILSNSNFRIVMWAADKNEEQNNIKICELNNIEEVRSWAEIEITMYDGEESFWKEFLNY